MCTMFIFIPDSLDLTNEGFLLGFAKQFENIALYVTSDKLVTENSQIIGYCSEKSSDNCSTTNENSAWIHINNVSGEVTVHNVTKPIANITCILYNLEEFQKCEYSSFKSRNNGLYFDTLCEGVQMKPERETKFTNVFTILLFLLDSILNFFFVFKLHFKYSSTVTHLENSIVIVKRILMSTKTGRKTLEIGNLVFSKIFDFTLGIIVLFFVLQYKGQIFVYVNEAIETIIHNLRDLLDTLMGSPIGLKLNHAFNMTLGIFFFYHISLWRVFVQFTRPFLYSALYFLLFPAVLGFSFQIAIVEDLIKFCTIHIYCIYVYAARLYGLQIHTLLSLWRLFIGRKYNPLRHRVDSYQYSHHQLFIGTLGFTIFLFLLPTTLLYYVVFTVFRLGLRLLSFVLTGLRVILQDLPLYVIMLWMLSSPRITGTIVLKVIPGEKNKPFTLHATLETSLWESVKCTHTDAVPPVFDVSCSKVFHHVLVGILL